MTKTTYDSMSMRDTKTVRKIVAKLINADEDFSVCRPPDKKCWVIEFHTITGIYVALTE